MKKQSISNDAIISRVAVPVFTKAQGSTLQTGISRIRKKLAALFFFFALFSVSHVKAQVGTLTGTGQDCAGYGFQICPSQTIVPLNYSGDFYCDSFGLALGVSFNIEGTSWIIKSTSWNFSANISGTLSGYDASPGIQSYPFAAGDNIAPMSYSAGMVQFMKNGAPFGVPLSEGSFSISIDAAIFGANSFTYCPSDSMKTISPLVPVDGGPWTFDWQPGGLTGNPVDVAPSVNTTYTVIATTDGTLHCLSETTVDVIVSCPPPPSCCIGNPCASSAKNPLTTNWEVPLRNFNYVFRKSMEEKGLVGIGVVACTPGNLLEVNKGQVNNVSGLRLTDLATATPLSPNNKVLSIDGNGDVILVSGSGITNACATASYVPVTLAGGSLSCSQIFDDGTSVGIGTNTGFTYTWPGGLTGPTAPAGSGTVKLNINGVSKALAYFATSDQRFKREIKTISNASEILSKLEGKTYFWKTEEYKDKGFSTLRQYGFIAQELEKVVPEAVATDENGYKSVNYDMIIPILVQNAKEQAAEIKDLQQQLDELKEVVKSLASNHAAGTNGTGAQSVTLSDKNAVILNQNVPNPFAESTVVNYMIGQDFVKAQIIFTTSDGKVIKSVEIREKGAGTLNVFSDDLSNGLYSYSLIVDGKVIDTKKMVKQ
jgi:hypothetical protein